MDDNELARLYTLGDKVTYTASNPLRSPNIDAYPATVISSAAVSPKGVRYRIEYVREGRTICSWVSAKKLRKRK